MMEKIKDKLKTKRDELTDLEKCLSDKDYFEKKFGKKKEPGAVDILEMGRVELIRRMRGLSREEWEIVINEAPIELCHERIGRELREAKEFKKSIGAAVDSVKSEEVW